MAQDFPIVSPWSMETARQRIPLKTHKHNHIAVLLEGTVQVVSKYGTAVFEAPYIANINVGDKRAFNSITRVKWMTIHATDETDLDKLELELVES